MRHIKTANKLIGAGFTLVELLVVMAITAILLGLIFGPLIQGFNLTNRARVQSLAQDTGRRAMEDIQRTIVDSAYVGQGSYVNLWVPDKNGNPQVQWTSSGIADIILMARANDRNPTVPRDPTTRLPVDRGELFTPFYPGDTLIRYWVGLRDNASMHDPNLNYDRPIKLYTDFYENPVGHSVLSHNPFILYSARYSLYVVLPNGQRVPDTRLFHVDANGNPILQDPNFFYDNSVAVAPAGMTSSAIPGWKDLNGDGKVNISENWRTIAAPLVPIDRADMAVAERDSNKDPVYDSVTGWMHLRLLTNFQPTYVGNDPSSPSSQRDTSNESPTVPPSRYYSTYGTWLSGTSRIYLMCGDLASPTLSYFVFVPGQGNVKYFDGTTSQLTDTGFSPITLLPIQGGTLPRLNFAGLNTSVPQAIFTFDQIAGVVDTAMSESVYWHDADGNSVNSPGAVAPLEYSADPVNAHKVDLVTYRWLSLLTLPNGSQSPLFQLWNYNSSRQRKGNVAIVPGSEVVRGPDQRPGPHHGQAIMYTRVARSLGFASIGLNEYMINYDDRTPDAVDPIMQRGTIIFDSGTDELDPLPTIRLDANGVSLAAAPISVSWKVQNNTFFDGSNNPRPMLVKTDYITRELINVNLGVRLYDLNSGQPQQFNLVQKFRVRNVMR